MPALSLCLQESATVIAMQKLKNGSVAAATETGGIVVFNPAGQEVLSRMSIPELAARKRTPCAFSPDGRFFVFAQAEPNAIRLIDIQTKKLLRSYATQENRVELLCFDPRSDYIVAGSNTGRVFVWRHENTSLLARLASFPEYDGTAFRKENNFVSAAAFRSHLIATTGYGGSVVVTNLQTLSANRRFKPGKIRIDALAFLDESHLLIGNIDGVVAMLHLDEKRPMQRISTGLGPIHHLLVLPNRKFALAASHFGNIALLDIETMRVVHGAFISLDTPLRTLCLLDGNTLLVGLNDGRVLRADLLPMETFTYYVDYADYEEAYALCEREPLLQYTSRYRQLETRFEQAFSEAMEALSKNRKEAAYALLEPFETVASKRQRIDALFSAFEHYPRLLSLIKERRYPLFYSIASRYPLLKETPAYATVEQQWESTFLEAQRLMLAGKPQETRTLLFPYSTVVDKAPLIRLLLDKPEAFKAFAIAVNGKDFPEVKRLTDTLPPLRKLPSYRHFIRSHTDMEEAVIASVKEQAFEKARLLYNELLLYAPTSADRRLERFIEKAQKLSRAYEKGDAMLCYELLDTLPELDILPLATKLEARWTRQVKECESAALLGNVVSIKSSLGPLIALKSRSERIGNILRVAYQMQIKHFITKALFEQAERGIGSYIAIFGIDNELGHIVTLLKKQGHPVMLTPEQEQRRPRTLWLARLKSELPDNIAAG